MHEQSMEFGFLADTPQRKTKEGLISQVKRFWKETDGGAIPVALAAKILKCSPQGIYKYIKNGKIRGHRFNNTVCLLYTSPSPRDRQKSRMPSSA